MPYCTSAPPIYSIHVKEQFSCTFGKIVGTKIFHPGLAEIHAPVGPQEVVGHTLNSQLLIGFQRGILQ